MPLQVSLMKEEDIDGAIDTIQQAFADDPYAVWVYDRSKVRTAFTPARTHTLHSQLMI